MGLGDNPVVYLSKKVWHYSRENRKNVILYIFLFLIANAINFLQPLVVGYLLNTIQEEGITSQSLPLIIKILSLFVILTVAFWIFHWPARVIERKNAFIVRSNYKQFLIEGVMKLDATWHSNHHSGDSIDKIEKGTSALHSYAAITFEVIETIIRFTGSYIALAYFNLHASYLVLLMVVITLFIIIQFDRLLIKHYKELNKQENQISAKIFDTISNITTVIILRVQKIVSSNIYKKIMQPFQLYIKNNKINETKWFLVSVCGSIMTFLVLFTFIYESYETGTVILVGTLYILYGYVDRINGLFFRFAYRYGEIVREKTAVMNAEELVADFSGEKKKSGKLSKWNKIEIRNLHFSYHPKKGGERHLYDVNMTVRKGEKIAFIGESGSGKTTMLKVMIDLYTPHRIDLYVGKEKIEGFNTISESITLIPQDPELFNTTIAENITMGAEHPISDMDRYSDIACFAPAVNRLPNRYESSIKEKGVNLSGGERQRLALARGLLACKNKEIILLDEPTSSVDSKNEMDIYANIFKEFKGKTVISSIHRLHLLKMFDKIYYFRKGKIIAQGTFAEMKENQEFRKIWKKYMKR